MSRSFRTALAVGAALGFGTLAGNGVAPHAAPPGEIVFVSDRASVQPGEIYLLAADAPPRDVSRSPAADRWAATAADGRIAFWRFTGRTSYLFVASAEGTGLRKILTTTADGGEPWFSPDGSKLLVWESSGIKTKTSVVDVASGAVTVRPRGCFPGGWSPDGTRIACVANNHTLLLALDGRVVRTLAGSNVLWVAPDRLTVMSRPGRTELVDDHGTVVRRLAGNPVAASPDGRLVAVTRPGALMLVSGRTGRAIRSITGPPGWTTAVTFSPDSRELAYDAPDGTFRSLPTAGGAALLLPAPGVWTRDAHYAFLRVARDQRHADVMIGDRHGLRARPAGHFPFDAHEVNRLLPAAGGRVVYSTSVRSHRDLWSIAPDGTNLRRLTGDGNDLRDPAWSADGTRLAFAAAPFSGGLCGFCTGYVALASTDGRVQSTIPATGDGDASPAWAPNARVLAVAHGFEGEIDTVGLDGSGRSVLVPGGAGEPAWSPDGKTILFGATGGIHLRTPDGKNDRLVVADASSPAWSNDGGLLAYVRGSAIYVAPAAVPAQGRRVASGRDPSFSPSGDSFAFTGRDGIFVVGVDGTGLHRVTSTPGCSGCYVDAQPAWRPRR
jgi:Tol biopolymer transport system component